MATELKVGIFTIIAIATLVIMAVVLEGNPFKSKSQTYYTILENAAGLGPRTQVRASGVHVGEVSSIDILPQGARVNFRISEPLQIPKGSHLELRTRGLLGDVFLEIVRSTDNNSGEFVQPGGLIPKSADSADMSALMSSMGNIAKDVQTVTHSLAAVLGNANGEASLTRILKNVQSISENLNEIIQNERENVSVTLKNIRDISQRVNDIMERNSDKVDDTLHDLSLAMADLRIMAEKMRGVVEGPSKDRLEHILQAADDSMANLRTVSTKVEQMVSKIEKGEGSLGQLVAKDDTVNELRATIKNVQDLIKPANKLRLEIDYKGEVRTRVNSYMGRAGNHMNVRLSPASDRFYLLGASETPTSFKVVRTTTERSQQDGKEIVKIQENIPDDRPRIRYNVQYAKRFDNLSVRFGLFESYPGVAGDVYLLSDRLQASVEAFQFSDGVSGDESVKGLARIKTYANLFLTPNVYLTGGADNIGKQSGTALFLGAGLRFNDDDLKSIIGAASIAK